jgi:hypothetical protein
MIGECLQAKVAPLPVLEQPVQLAKQNELRRLRISNHTIQQILSRCIRGAVSKQGESPSEKLDGQFGNHRRRCGEEPHEKAPPKTFRTSLKLPPGFVFS